MRFGAIDQGTTSTRALTIDRDGRLRVVHTVQHRQFYPQSGWVEHDPEELISAIQACAEALGDVTAIGIGNQGESCLAWDGVTKQALSPVIVWQDNRTAAHIQMLKDQGHESVVQARSGLPLDPYFSASKLAWIIDNIPAAAKALEGGTLRLGTTDAFFLDRLTGQFKTDVSTASRTSLMNLDTLAWDADLCALFGIPIKVLPRITPTTGDFGTIKTAAGPIPVTASIVDQQGALYGFGCHTKGAAKITFGTGAFALMNTGDKILRQPGQGLLPTVAWQLEGQDVVYALDGGVYTASAAVNWAKSLGLFDDFAQINQFDAPPAIDRGLTFVPALTGLGCPHWDPDARGTWLGLSLDHGAMDMVQAILEGVALRAAQVMRMMTECAPLTGALPVDGGMTRNPYFTTFLADVLEREILPAQVPELTGLGTLMLAAHAHGVGFEGAIKFDQCQPRPRGRDGLRRFDQACHLSRQWGGSGGRWPRK
ncbi:MAG: glycerol kinase [Rhodobacteraceae bacterium]|nr:glycerol kinase [Paracoccaceae bacterium]